MTLARFAAGAAAAAGVVRLAMALGPRRLPGGAQRWERTNHAGRTVSLVEGPALVAGTGTASLGCPPAGAAAIVAGALGLLDDLAGTTSSKGLRGHLTALRRGEVTTGAVKIVGLAVTGAAAAAAIDGRARFGAVLGGGVVAGTANLVNLFDLRPGRALKVTLVLAAASAAHAGWAHGALVGASLAALPEDLAATQMMGDTGANALGALAGTLIVSRAGWRGRTLVLTLLTALTLASERISFSRVIAEQPVLRRVDEWGRAGA